MPKTPKQMQIAADGAFTRGLEKWLASLDSTETAARRLHDGISRLIRRSLGDNPRPGDAQRVIRRELRRAAQARLALIRNAITEAASRGAEIPESVASAVFGRDAARAYSPRIVASEQASIVAGQRMSGAMLPDRVGIARRLNASTLRISRSAAEQIDASLRLGESVTQSANRLLANADIEVRIPRYIEDVRAAVRSADPSQVKRVVSREMARLRQGNLANQDISSDTRAFLRRVRRSQGEDIDAALEQWVQGRARNRAMTIARTEGQLAHAQAYVQQIQNEDWVPAFRWNLSPGHKRPDVCDVMASQDLFGLGEGGYPSSDVPSLAHPNDMCFFTAIIDPHHFDRQRAIREGSEEPPRPWESGTRQTGSEWLSSQTPERRRAILGPGRAAEFERRPNGIVNSNGSLNPLYRAQGRRPPPRADGQRVLRGRDGSITSLTDPPPRRRRR